MFKDDLIHNWASQKPEAIALIDRQNSWSYAQVDKAVDMLVESLNSYDLQEGQRVALELPKTIQQVLLLWALLRMGVVVCPLSLKWPEELRAKVCLTLEVFPLNNVPSAVIEEILKHVQDDVTRASIIYRHPEPVFRPSSRRSYAKPGSLNNAGMGSTYASILHTSGSTGTPKAALHTYENHISSAKASNQNIPIGPNDCWLLSLGLDHIAGWGILFRSFLAGAAVAVPDQHLSLQENLKQLSVTHVSLVQTQLKQLLDQGFKPQGLKAVLLGGSAIDDALLEQAYSQGYPLYRSYGLTEMSSQVSTTQAGASLEELKTSGRILPHVQLNIAEDRQIALKGPSLFCGYLKDGQLHKPFDEQGWFKPGDLGFFDGQGRLCIEGRKDRMFVSGGENIDPLEIEQELLKFPGVQKARVSSQNDLDYGQKAIAYLKMKENIPIPREKLKIHLKRHLPPFKCPKEFCSWDALV